MEDEVILTLLLANTDITDIVGQRVVPQLGEEGAPVPFVMLRRVNTNTEYALDGLAVQTIEFQIDVFSVDYDEATTIADLCYDTLDNFTGTVGGVAVQHITLMDEQDESDPELRLFILSQNYEMHV